MSQKDPPLEQLLPVELRLLILEAELERLESDGRWVEQRRNEVTAEIKCCHEALEQKRKRSLLRRVK